jgi:hypothetical protein
MGTRFGVRSSGAKLDQRPRLEDRGWASNHGGEVVDVEKTIQFLLEQAARADARLEKHVARFEQEMTRINSTLVVITAMQQHAGAVLDTLAERQLQIEESHYRGMQELREVQKDTTQKLNVLISLFERHILDHK